MGFSRKNCCVPHCSSNKIKHPDLTFHIFPKEEKMRKAWILILRIGKKEVSKHLTVCSKHFEKSDFFFPYLPTKKWNLKKTALPRNFLPLLPSETAEDARKTYERVKRYLNISRERPTVVSVSSTTSASPNQSASPAEESQSEVAKTKNAFVEMYQEDIFPFEEEMSEEKNIQKKVKIRDTNSDIRPIVITVCPTTQKSQAAPTVYKSVKINRKEISPDVREQSAYRRKLLQNIRSINQHKFKFMH